MNKTFAASSGSVWAACKSSDEPDLLLLQTEISPNWNTRGYVKFLGTASYTSIDIEQLQRKHFSFIKNCHKIDTHIETYFNIQPFLIMKLSWTTSALLPSLSAYRKADVLLYQTVHVGHPSSVADDFWRQLLTLDLIKSNILRYKDSEEKCHLVYSSGSELRLSTIKDKILEILSDVMPFSMNPERNPVELESVITKATKRDLIDITDQLWMLLKLSCSYDDLKIAFNYIFQCAARCNVVNMPSNKNHLAELIREISQQRLAVPCLTGTEPLELLLEIGLEKAVKDYEHIFTDSKICSVQDLTATSKRDNARSAQSNLNVRKTLCNAAAATSQPIVETVKTTTTTRQTLMLRNQISHETTASEKVGFQNSTFDRSAVEQRLDKLAQIHLLMEHLLLIQVHLNWSDMQNYVRDELKKTTAPFSSLKAMFYDRREIPILCDKVIAKVEGRDPNAQSITMISENEFKSIANTFYFSINPILPPNVFPCVEIEEKEATKTSLYCGLHYMKLKTKMK